MTEAGMQGARGRGSWIVICALAAPFAFGLFAQSAAAVPVPPVLSKVSAFAVTGTSAMLKAEIDPQGAKTTYSFEYGSEDCGKPSACTIFAAGSIPPIPSSPSVVVAPLEGLSPLTLYHFRVVVKHAGEPEVSSGDRSFTTRSASFQGPPDGRSYEQASPIDKDGGDIQGYIPLIKATESGGGITFESTFGVPGGKGAQEFPTYLASRTQSSWSTEGLLPPFSAGERAQVIGWSPDFSEVFSKATRLGAPRASALIVQRGSAAPVQITPYTAGGEEGAGAEYFYAGQSSDGSVVLFESPSKFVAEALEGVSNLYAWDRATGKLSLAGVDNHKTSPPKGTLAGAYLWPLGSSGRALRLGGAQFGMYLRDERAIAPDGSIYFTEAGTGQLYRRLNPTKEQSDLITNGKGEEECIDPAKACTIHISASQKTDGDGEGGRDGAGAQPAAFQAAGADGSEAFFTSPEKMTNDANTGPEQSPAQIERDDLTGGPVEKPDFITPQAALGVAVDGSHIYWADPTTGTIGRADLNGTLPSREPEFIKPGTIECEVPDAPGTFEEVESTPRYVAVDAGHVYWTNTGCRGGEFETPIEGTGTIGRADIDGTAASIEAEFITGASNPQGIAVNATHIYWANAGNFGGVRAIGRATIEGEEVKQSFIEVPDSFTPYGVALSATHVYYSADEEGADGAYMLRALLGGGGAEGVFIGKEGIRGLAIDSAHVYWATQGEEAIGRADLALENKENEFIKLEGKPTGVALDGAHLYWSTNGESPTNPGNDLYRYGPAKGELKDLTPLAGGNGAEVQGVLGASGDGKYVYFAANGVLDAAKKATQGNCKGPLISALGNCSLYLWHEGQISLIARLRAGGSSPDALNWTPTPRELFGTASYVAKTSFLSADGQTLLFRSQDKLTAYDNAGTAEFYRFRVGDPAGIRCVSCNPAGEAAGEGPGTGRLHFPKLGPLPSVAAVQSRILSADGEKAFFETTEALVPEDVNGQVKCPNVSVGEQVYPACLDVYEWEAPGTPGGSCHEGSAAYSPLNAGCVYLLSTGKSKYPSLFADASASGNDVFFFTRDQLVGQDKDELQDVYDARVGGGLASQNPVSVVPCEAAESCHGPAQTPPAESSPATPTFAGPQNPKPKHKKQNKKKAKKHHKSKGHKHKGQKHKRANAKGRNAR
jgi:hypothetical protein